MNSREITKHGYIMENDESDGSNCRPILRWLGKDSLNRRALGRHFNSKQVLLTRTILGVKQGRKKCVSFVARTNSGCSSTIAKSILLGHTESGGGCAQRSQ